MICTSHDNMISPFMFCGGHELSLYVAFTRKKIQAAQWAGVATWPQPAKGAGLDWLNRISFLICILT